MYLIAVADFSSMICKCVYDKNRDFQEVVPGLSLSVTEALLTGVVKDTATSTSYSKETDVNVIGNYVTDNIDVALALKKIGKSLSSMPTSQTPSTPSGEGA